LGGEQNLPEYFSLASITDLINKFHARIAVPEGRVVSSKKVFTRNFGQNW